MNSVFPKVSVLLPVYNGEAYIEETIISILAQTFNDFELIVIDDCSSDETLRIINKYIHDSRVHVISNDKNLRLAETLNKGMTYCSGKYIARIDADDIAFPTRLSEQFEFLENHPDFVLVGCEYITFGTKKRYITLPGNDHDCRSALLTCSPFCHPGVMFRSDIIVENRLQYDKDYPQGQDYKFFSELAKYGKICNIKKPLMYYRLHENQITNLYKSDQFQRRMKVVMENNNLNSYDLDKLYSTAKNSKKITPYFMKGYLELCLNAGEKISLKKNWDFFKASNGQDYFKFLFKKYILK